MTQGVEPSDSADRGGSEDASPELGGVRSEADREAGTVDSAEAEADDEGEADERLRRLRLGRRGRG